MAGHHQPRLEREQLVDAREPLLAVRFAHERDAAGEEDVAAEDHALRGHHDDYVIGGMSRTHVSDFEAHAAHFEAFVTFEPTVGGYERHLLVDPGKQVPRALLEPAL